ncbi:MAG TPA: ATP-binding cassette domain-containing protein [Epulopiscium sp.]|nr:ATP-binding cassette domain-containing protein [Candidatus Epulonipiscium sp.]
MIVIKDLYKEFIAQDQTVSAVNNVSIHVDKGDIFGIIGLSGAGKSTLVRCINRLEEPTRGHIYIGGEEITGASEKQLREMRKKTGMIFQHFHLLNMRTVEENIAFPLEISNIPNKEERITDLLRLVELEDKRHSYPSQLSGGQKQRVGIARALANNPSVLLCDEATSALDPKTTQSILELLKKINLELGVTMIMITHQMEVIKQICNRVAVMDGGRVIEQGTLTDIFANSKHPITSQFVSSVSHDLPGFLLTQNPNNPLMRISYQSERVGKPLLSKAIRKFNIDANILLGGIDNLGTSIIGNLVVEFSGDADQIQAAINYLEENNVICERVERNE